MVVVIRGRPATALPVVERIKAHGSRQAQDLAAWLRAHLHGGELVERDRYLVVPASMTASPPHNRAEAYRVIATLTYARSASANPSRSKLTSQVTNASARPVQTTAIMPSINQNRQAWRASAGTLRATRV